MNLSILDDVYSVCRLDPRDDVPHWVSESPFYAINKTHNELSLVVRSESIPTGLVREDGWRVIKVEGPLEFSLTGILNSITEPLAKAEVSIFAISTFDTDYVMVKKEKLALTQEVLGKSGFSFVPLK